MKSLHKMLGLLLIEVEVKQNLVTGLCGVISRMGSVGILTDKEEVYLYCYVNRNVPNTKYTVIGSCYFYKSGDLDGRIQFLNHHLSINKPR